MSSWIQIQIISTGLVPGEPLPGKFYDYFTEVVSSIIIESSQSFSNAHSSKCSATQTPKPTQITRIGFNRFRMYLHRSIHFKCITLSDSDSKDGKYYE
jgi:hypothetical protein